MVMFEYPGYNPTESFEIKSPDLLDAKSSNFEMNLEVSQSGKFKSTIQESKDGYITSLEFSKLHETEKDNFIEFLISAQEDYIKYTDYDGSIWIMQLTADSIQTTNSPEGWNISLEILRWAI